MGDVGTLIRMQKWLIEVDEAAGASGLSRDQAIGVLLNFEKFRALFWESGEQDHFLSVLGREGDTSMLDVAAEHFRRLADGLRRAASGRSFKKKYKDDLLARAASLEEIARYVVTIEVPRSRFVRPRGR